MVDWDSALTKEPKRYFKRCRISKFYFGNDLFFCKALIGFLFFKLLSQEKVIDHRHIDFTNFWIIFWRCGVVSLFLRSSIISFEVIQSLSLFYQLYLLSPYPKSSKTSVASKFFHSNHLVAPKRLKVLIQLVKNFAIPIPIPIRVRGFVLPIKYTQESGFLLCEGIKRTRRLPYGYSKQLIFVSIICNYL